MEKTEPIFLPPTLKLELQKKIKKYQNQIPKPQGFNEVVTVVGLGFLTKGGIAKINSFFNTKTNNQDDIERENVYGTALKTFCQSFLSQEKNKKAISNNIRTSTGHPTGAKTGNQQGRAVDRLNAVNTKSTEPPRTPKIGDLMSEVEAEDKLPI